MLTHAVNAARGPRSVRTTLTAGSRALSQAVNAARAVRHLGPRRGLRHLPSRAPRAAHHPHRGIWAHEPRAASALAAGQRLLPFLLAGGVGLGGYRARALTASGALAAALMGGVVLGGGGWPAAVALNTFFASSSLLGRWRSVERARSGALAQAKGGQRDAWQVLANGGVAAVALLAHARGWARGEGAFLGALGGACADTWATEVGTLAARSPRLATTWRVVPHGTSGAVTPLGLAASLSGGLLVGATWAALAGRSRLAAMRAAVVGGLVGSLADSLLGATLQARRWCPVCRRPTEARRHRVCGTPTAHVGGWRWVDNDVVNGLATLVGGLVGAAVWPGGCAGSATRGRRRLR